jgi:hypothetical protein
MPTLRIDPSSTQVAPNADRPKPINFDTLEFENFVTECPKLFGPDGFTPGYLMNNVIKGKHKLLFFTLDELNNLYFDDSKIRFLSKLYHTTPNSKQSNDKKENNEENNILPLMSNTSFYVTIGMKEAYENEFNRPKPPSEIRSIRLKNKGSSSQRTKCTYKDIFVDFFNQMFVNNESDQLEKSYEKENMLTVCIFARAAHKTKQKDVTKFTDQMVGAASFQIDEPDSVLLSWLGVLD